MASRKVVVVTNPAHVEVKTYTRPLFVAYGVTANQVYVSKVVAAIAGHIAANPFYVVQTLSQVGSKEGRKSYLKIIDDLFTKQGITAFFKGSLVGALRFASTATLNLLVNMLIKKLLADKNGVITVDQHHLAYAVSIIVSSLITYPLETIRTRLVLDWNSNKYSGAMDCLVDATNNEGWGSLYTGATLSAIANFIMIEVMERIWSPIKLGLAIVPPSLADAAVQSVIAQILYYPVDTVLKMVQAPVHYKSLHPDVRFDGVLEAAKESVNKHGFFALWRGCGIAALGIVPQVAAISLAFTGTTRIFEEVGYKIIRHPDTTPLKL